MFEDLLQEKLTRRPLFYAVIISAILSITAFVIGTLGLIIQQGLDDIMTILEAALIISISIFLAGCVLIYLFLKIQQPGEDWDIWNTDDTDD